MNVHTHMQSLHGRQDERILHELKEWHNNFISVQHFMDDLAVAKGRIRSIQEEVASNAYSHIPSSLTLFPRSGF